MKSTYQSCIQIKIITVLVKYLRNLVIEPIFNNTNMEKKIIFSQKGGRGHENVYY